MLPQKISVGVLTVPSGLGSLYDIRPWRYLERSSGFGRSRYLTVTEEDHTSHLFIPTMHFLILLRSQIIRQSFELPNPAENYHIQKSAKLMQLIHCIRKKKYWQQWMRQPVRTTALAEAHSLCEKKLDQSWLPGQPQPSLLIAYLLNRKTIYMQPSAICSSVCVSKRSSLSPMNISTVSPNGKQANTATTRIS